MKKFTAVVTVIFLLALSSCAFLQDTAMVGVEANRIMSVQKDLTQKFKKVETLISVVQEESINQGTPVFNEKEWAKLKDVADNVDLALTKMMTIRTADDLMNQSDSLLSIVYLIEESYLDGREVVYSHLESFSQRNQVQLIAFDQMASEDWGDIKKLLKNPTSQNIKEALEVAGDLLDITLAMLGRTSLLLAL
jgi:hypothetical protein